MFELSRTRYWTRLDYNENVTVRLDLAGQVMTDLLETTSLAWRWEEEPMGGPVKGEWNRESLRCLYCKCRTLCPANERDSMFEICFCSWHIYFAFLYFINSQSKQTLTENMITSLLFYKIICSTLFISLDSNKPRHVYCL